MAVKIISYDKDLFEEFPNSKCIYNWDGGLAFTAKKGRKYILWTDEREILDFLEGVDENWLSKDLIRLYIFDSEKERKKYIETLKVLKKPKPSRNKNIWEKILGYFK